MYSYISLGENIYTYIILKYMLNIEYNIKLPFDLIDSNINTLINIFELCKDHHKIDAFYCNYFINIDKINKKGYDNTFFLYDNIEDIHNIVSTYSIKTYNLLNMIVNNNKKILLKINKLYDISNNITIINNLLDELNINYIIITINNNTEDIFTNKYINLYIPYNNNINNWYNNIINKLKTLNLFNSTISKINNYINLSNDQNYFNKLINNIKINNNVNNLDFLLNNLITSFSLYYISNHYIGDELERFNVPVIPKSNNILKNNNIDAIKDMDILFVQNNYFDIFISDYLPNIKVNFILITGQWNLPQLHINEKTTRLLNDNKIFKWFSQNPIFKHEKYIPFPYGLNYGYNLDNPEIKIYANELLNINNDKKENIINLPMNYITNNCRSIFEKMPYMDNKTYYKLMNDSKFILSPIGDRDETYRYWEAIGLGTIPISNVGSLYKDLFEDNMIYVNDTYEMLNMYKINLNLPYKIPNKNFICLEYWKDYIKNNIKQ